MKSVVNAFWFDICVAPRPGGSLDPKRYDLAVNTSPGKVAYHPLMRRLTHGLRQRCGVREGDTLLVAVSGGADSVALLRGLRLLAPRRRWRLTLHVGHVQHHLRPPEEAETDAAFVEALAGELSLPFHRRDITVPAGNVEAQARRLRYAALTGMARDAGASFIATAHHADDHLETILMRLLRGTTARGLRGIAWRRAVKAESPASAPAERGHASDTAAVNLALIRPMLAATHAEAIDFLRVLNQAWREDATNADASRTRARLRHAVLPVLHELRPSVARKVLELSDSLREDRAKEKPR